MNQGAYRAGGNAGGLPLPRKGLGLATAAILSVAAVAVVMPVALLVISGGGAGAWTLFRNGGLSMYVVLLFELVSPAIVGVLGIFLIRGRKAPPLLMLALAGLPFAFSLAGATMGMRMVIGAIGGESVDPEQKTRILAEGVSETMSCDIFGGFVACGAAIVVAVACASAVATIAGPKPKAPIGVIVSGALWASAALVLGGLRLRTAGGITLLPFLAIVVLAPAAICAARQAGALREWHDRAESARMGGALVIAGVAAVFAVLALQRAIEAGFDAKAFSAISGEALDESQRMRVLAQAVFAGKLGPASYAVHAVLGTLTFGLALLPTIGKGPDGAARSPFTLGALAGVAGVLLLLGGALAIGAQRSNASSIVTKSREAPTEVALPSVVGTFSIRGRDYAHGSRLMVRKTDPSEPVSARCSGTSEYMAYADKSAKLGALRGAALRGNVCTSDLTLVVDRQHPPEVDKLLGGRAKFLGNTAYIAVKMMPFEMDFDPTDLVVQSISDSQLLLDEITVSFPLPPDTKAPVHAHLERVMYQLRASETVDHAVQVITQVEALMAGQITFDAERDLEIAR